MIRIAHRRSRIETSLCCNGHALESKKCLKFVLSAPPGNLWTFFDISRHFSDILSAFPFFFLGCTLKGAYSSRGRSGHLLETAFSEPLLRTLLRTLFYCKTHSRPSSQNPSENPFPRTLPRTFSEPFLERCVAVRPLRRAPYFSGCPTICPLQS